MAKQFSCCLSRTGYLLALRRGAATVLRRGAQGNAATEGVSRREAAAASVRRFGGQYLHSQPERVLGSERLSAAVNCVVLCCVVSVGSEECCNVILL
jgi:hypothetical protein